jgi:hypothetical protein
MLDCIGDEVARATSIVRYAPGSHFSPIRMAAGGILFLEGVFQDEHGEFPARSVPGCILFVKPIAPLPSDRG